MKEKQSVDWNEHEKWKYQPAATAYLNLKGKILDTNLSLQYLFGCPGEYFTDKSIDDFIHSKNETCHLVNKILEKIEITDRDCTIISEKKTEKNVRISTRLVKNEKNKDIGFLVSFIDKEKFDSRDPVTLTLYKILGAVNSTRNLQELYESIRNTLSLLIDTRNFHIALYDKRLDIISYSYFSDEKDYCCDIINASESGTLTSQVILNNKPLLINHNQFSEKITNGEASLFGPDSEVWLGVPLKLDNEVIGAVIVQSYTDPDLYSKKDIELLESVSEILAIAVRRKQNEEELRVEKTYFEMLFESAPEGIVLVGNDGRIIRVNNEFKKMFGYSEEEVLDKIINELVFSKNYQDETEKFAQKLAIDKTAFFEARCIRKDGSKINISFTVKANKINDEIIDRYVIFRDISRRKAAEDEKNNLQEQLFQAQKMESIGRLAGSIAHDFNNILATMLGYSEMFKIKIKEDDPMFRGIDIIHKSTKRARQLTQQLLSFARGGDNNPEPLNVNNVIEESVNVASNLLKKNIKTISDLQKDINIVEVDENQLHQVFTNLIINAKDAMPDGGELTFKTENILLNEADGMPYPYFTPGDYVKISITDTGTGMKKEVVNNIFEPFFTTKEKGKGTGLGLSTAYGIIKNHNGFIICQSVPEEGTTFIIYLPVC